MIGVSVWSGGVFLGPGSAVAEEPALGAKQPDPLFDDVASEPAPPAGFPDPIEPFNRKILWINQQVDQWFLDPVTRTYRFIAPQPFKRGLRNVFSNLNSSVVFANDVLQWELNDAGITLWRLVINTTVGVGGILDVGDFLGVEGHVSDFDQTMALYGVDSGPFLILPLLGPTTARGLAGVMVDLMFRPTAYLLGPVDQLTFSLIHGGSAGLSYREQKLDDIKALQDTSIDYYATLRNAYYQNRMAEIWRRGKPTSEKEN